ncbi:hypothetical protein AB1Y20_003326 [Prymnesium parvum]|uniref:Secreted protein n=1 Tax=Prymnesium parvum TaxID=97485 RepID=A0AB34JDB4_PRYPA
MRGWLACLLACLLVDARQLRRPPTSSRGTPLQLALTCRVCKSTYEPEANGPRACRSHPGSLRGESARKGDWEGDRGPNSGKGGDIVYSWSCCGAPAEDAGCVVAPHASYDE